MVIDLDRRTVTALRRKVTEMAEANEALVAFARGHSGAVASIHAATLAALEADSLEHLLGIVTLRWPALMALDVAAAALVTGSGGLRTDAAGPAPVEPRFVRAAADAIGSVTMRQVTRGHPLFGTSAADIRAEALVRLDLAGGGVGVLALGQHDAPAFDGPQGRRLLLFLGGVVSRMAERWPD